MKTTKYLIISAVLFSFTSCLPNTGSTQTGQSSNSFSLIFLPLMILVFWMFFIRPQAKRSKDQQKFISDLQKGDKVVTIAGIHGIVNKVNDDGTLNIEINPGSYIKMEKSAISQEWTTNLNKANSEKK